MVYTDDVIKRSESSIKRSIAKFKKGMDSYLWIDVCNELRMTLGGGPLGFHGAVEFLAEQSLKNPVLRYAIIEQRGNPNEMAQPKPIPDVLFNAISIYNQKNTEILVEYLEMLEHLIKFFNQQMIWEDSGKQEIDKLATAMVVGNKIRRSVLIAPSLSNRTAYEISNGYMTQHLSRFLSTIESVYLRIKAREEYECCSMKNL